MYKSVLVSFLLLLSTNSIADMSCSEELAQEVARVEGSISELEAAGEKSVIEAFSTDKYASSVDKARLAQGVYRDSFKSVIDEELLQITEETHEIIAQLSKQSRFSKVCRDRSLIKQVGQSSLDAVTDSWGMKLLFIRSIAEGDGELTPAIMEKLAAVL